MEWNLEGHRISAVYMELNHVTGRVIESRVAYGGRVLHTIELDHPLNFFGRARDRVIVDHEDVTSVIPDTGRDRE